MRAAVVGGTVEVGEVEADHRVAQVDPLGPVGDGIDHLGHGGGAVLQGVDEQLLGGAHRLLHRVQLLRTEAFTPPPRPQAARPATAISVLMSLWYATRIVSPSLWTTLAARSGHPIRWLHLGCALALGCFALFLLPLEHAGLFAVMLGFCFAYNAVMPQFEAMTLTALGPRSDLYGRLRVWGSIGFLFVAAMFVGIARAFSGPAYSALAPNLVPRAVLPTAIAVSSMAWQVGTIAGPSVGGVLYAIDPNLAYGSIAGMFAAALLLIFLISPVAQPPVQKDRRPIQRMVDGFRYVRDNRLVMATITLDLFVVLFAGATALLPVFARDILKVGADGFGLLAAGMGIGATAASIWFSFFPMKSDVGVKMLGAVIVFALAIVTFGLSKIFWLSLIALVVAGAADMVSVYIRQSLIQLHTPDEMRGRVGAVSALTISASNELGETESGLLAAVIGPVAAVVTGGIAAIFVTLYWARLFPELRLAKTFDPPPQADTNKTQEALP